MQLLQIVEVCLLNLLQTALAMLKVGLQAIPVRQVIVNQIQ